jgi:Thymidylate synthase
MIVISCNDSANHAYLSLIEAILDRNLPLSASRLGPACDVGPCMIEICNGPHLITLQGRAINPFFAIVEACWIASGRREVTPLEFAVRGYRRFSDDGTTLNGAYGHRLRVKYSVDQISTAVSALRQDRTSRRIYLPIYDADDLVSKSLDIPCNVGIMLIVRNELLDMTVINRSNDAYLGVPYDIFSFSFLHWLISLEAGIALGAYRHFSNCMHLYEVNVKSARQIAGMGESCPAITNDDMLALFEEMRIDCQAIGSLDVECLTSLRLKVFLKSLVEWRRSGDAAALGPVLGLKVLGPLLGNWMAANGIGT